MDSAGGIEGNERGWDEGAWAQERRLPGGHSSEMGRWGDGVAVGGKACAQQKPATAAEPC